MLLGLGRARVWAGAAADEELREAAAALVAAGRPELAAEAEFLIGDRAWYGGDRKTADEQLARALALVEPLPPSRSKAWILSQASRMAMLASRDEESLDYGRGALELADALGLPEIRVHALASVGTVRAGNGQHAGITELEESAALARQLNSPEIARSLNNLATVYGIYGRKREAAETNRLAVAAAERFGLRAIAMYSRGNSLYYLYDQGQWDEASAAADALIDEAVAMGLHSTERMALETRARVRLGRDDVAGAERDSARALELGRNIGDPQALIPALAVHVVVLLRAGRPEARPLAEELRSAAAGVRLPFQGGTESVSVARCLGIEDWLLALETRSTWRTPWLEAMTELLRGDLDRAVERYAALATPVDEAFARMEAAKAHLGAGRRAEAEAHLEAALAFFRKAGASRYVAEAETLLAAPAA